MPIRRRDDHDNGRFDPTLPPAPQGVRRPVEPLPPERAEAQKSWLHTRGTDRLLRAIDASEPARPPAERRG